MIRNDILLIDAEQIPLLQNGVKKVPHCYPREGQRLPSPRKTTSYRVCRLAGGTGSPAGAAAFVPKAAAAVACSVPSSAYHLIQGEAV
jgi:hypothetical protein